MTETFDKIANIKNNDILILEILQSIEKTAIQKYQEYTGRCSGMNDSRTNQHIRETSYEFASFIAELKNKINTFGPFYLIEKDFESIKFLQNMKNDIVDVVYPKDKIRCRQDYQEIMRKSAILADKLEEFFIMAYSFGKENRTLADETDECEFKRMMEDCKDRLNKAYNKGSKTLCFLLQAALSDEKIMNELKERKIL